MFSSIDHGTGRLLFDCFQFLGQKVGSVFLGEDVPDPNDVGGNAFPDHVVGYSNLSVSEIAVGNNGVRDYAFVVAAYIGRRGNMNAKGTKSVANTFDVFNGSFESDELARICRCFHHRLGFRAPFDGGRS